MDKDKLVEAAQPGQEQRMVTDAMINAGGTAVMKSAHLTGCERAKIIYTAMEAARPTADLDDAVARIEAAVDECSSDKASECLNADSFFQDAQTGRAIYVRDIRALLGKVRELASAALGKEQG